MEEVFDRSESSGDDAHKLLCASAGKFGVIVVTQYTVIYEPGERNWSAYVPDLPGCIATAKTRKRLEIQIREAIEFHIEGLRLRGEKIPEPTIEAGTVAVTA